VLQEQRFERLGGNETALPDLNLLLAEIYVNPTERVPGVEREQQVWIYRSVDARPDPTPAPPAGLTVKTEARAAVLEWTASPSAGADGHVVYRGQGEHPWTADFQRLARTDSRATSCRDADAPPGAVSCYFVRATTKDRTVGPATPIVRRRKKSAARIRIRRRDRS
jgi:hypothetical protein